jgi:hypothetical protein
MAVYLAYYQDADSAAVQRLARAASHSERPVLVHAALAAARVNRTRSASKWLRRLARRLPASAEIAAARAEVARLARDPQGQVSALNRWNEGFGLAPIVTTSDAADLRLPVRAASLPEPIHDGPLVSVIMPVYKRGPLLEMAVESVLEQTYRNLEVLLVDDASPDDTALHLARWASADARVRVLRMPTNGGPYLAKNAAMAESRGTYLAFADSDDWNHPERVARQVRLLQDSPRAQAVCVRYVRVSVDGHIVFRRTAVKTAWGSLLLRREAQERVGYFVPLRAGADTELIERIKAVFGGAAVAVDDAITLLAQHAASTLTATGSLAMGWRPVGGARQQHHLAFRRWHRRQLALGEPLQVAHPLDQLPYPVPRQLL